MEPFKDVDVLEFAQAVAAPYSTQLLGTLGADVVKVEPPEGDNFRPVLNGSMFVTANLGDKRSISLDLKSGEGREIALELAERADVIVEGFRPGVMEKFGLDYEAIRETNEEVIYCSVTGFGQEGKYSQWPAYDPVLQAMSGILSVTGHRDSPLARIGTSLIDYGTGMNAAFVIASALMEREMNGGSKYIDINLYEVAVSWMAYSIADYTGTGNMRERPGQGGFANLAPNGVFEAADGYFYLVTVNNTFWQRLCNAIDSEYLLSDERFETNDDRWEHRSDLKDELESIFTDWECEKLCQMLAEAGVPAGPIRTVDQVINDPHLEERELLTEVQNPMGDNDVQTPFPPFKTNEGRPDPGNGLPELGAHTHDILADLGYDDETIDAMLESSALYTPDTN